MADLDNLLSWVEAQENEAGMRDAFLRIHDAMEAATIAQPGNYL